MLNTQLYLKSYTVNEWVTLITEKFKTIGIAVSVFLLVILVIFIFKAVAFAIMAFIYLFKYMVIAGIIAFLVFIYLRYIKK